MATDGHEPTSSTARPVRRRSAARRYLRRAAVLLGAGVVALVVMALVITPMQDREDRLLTSGTPVTATVVRGHVQHDGIAVGRQLPDSGTLLVEYTLAGSTHQASLTWTQDSPVTRSGDRLTVYVDRADPERVAANGFDTAPPWLVTITVVGVACTLVLLLFGLLTLLAAPVAARRARRAQRAGL